MSSRGHFPAITKQKKRRRKKIITPRPTPLLLQSKLPSKLMPDLAHTGIVSTLEDYEVPPVMPNSRLNPTFKMMAHRRAHEVQFQKVRVENKKQLYPMDNFTRKNHFNFNNKIMIDILDENKREDELRAEEFARTKAALGFSQLGNTSSQQSSRTVTPRKEIDEIPVINVTKRAEEEKTDYTMKLSRPNTGAYTPKIRPKSYHSTLGLFECLWDTTEPPVSPIKKYGYAQNKPMSSQEDRFIAKTGDQIIFKEKWDPVATADAHFKRFQPVDSKLPVTDDGPPVIEGLNGNITREELEVLSRIRKDRAIGGDSTKLSTARPSDFSSFDF